MHHGGAAEQTGGAERAATLLATGDAALLEGDAERAAEAFGAAAVLDAGPEVAALARRREARARREVRASRCSLAAVASQASRVRHIRRVRTCATAGSRSPLVRVWNAPDSTREKRY